jgi:anti-anti-sigma factor
VTAVRKGHVVSDGGALLLRYRVAKDVDATIVHVTGEIDLSTSEVFADAMSQALDAGSTSMVVVDLQHVTFMGSIGLSALIRAHEEASLTDRVLRIASGGAVAHRAIEISGLDQVLAVFVTVDDAVTR